MKFLVTYEVRSEGRNQYGRLEFEAEQKPNLTNEALLNAVREDSVKFFRSGLAGLSITSISLVS